MNWAYEKLGNLITESRIPAINPDPNRRIRVKLNVLGVEKRPFENEVAGATKQFQRKAGQFIYGKQNFHKGAFGIIPDELDGFETSADIPSFDVREDCLAEWIFYYFKIGNRYLDMVKYARGVGSKRIHPEQIADIEIPLPSIKEQKKLIREFKLVEDNSQSISSEFINQENLLTQLRQSFLREAMQGKLVKQDPKDGHAKDLLEKIKAEKAKSGRKEKELPPIKPEEIPFEIPENWVWCRLNQACSKITDGTHHSPPNRPTGKIKYVTAKNIKDSGVDLSEITFVTEEVHREIYARCNPEFGDILYIKDGATTGVVTTNDLNEEFSMLSSVALLKIPKSICNKYLMYCMRSPFYYNATRNDMYGVAITRVTLEKLNKSIIPLPPYHEQLRIVKKVDEIMKICDGFEENIQASREQNELLLQQVLKEALMN